MELPDIFQPFDRLIKIEVMGQKYEVPENNTLLRCFQYLAMENISYGDFCWNGECLNCQVWLKNGDKDKAVMACRTIVVENMTIVKIADGIDLADG
jgi:hypothetical protein